MHHHIKFGYERRSGSEDTVWTKSKNMDTKTDTAIPIYPVPPPPPPAPPKHTHTAPQHTHNFITVGKKTREREREKQQQTQLIHLQHWMRALAKCMGSLAPALKAWIIRPLTNLRKHTTKPDWWDNSLTKRCNLKVTTALSSMTICPSFNNIIPKTNEPHRELYVNTDAWTAAG